jgi:hypothetical protein
MLVAAAGGQAVVPPPRQHDTVGHRQHRSANHGDEEPVSEWEMTVQSLQSLLTKAKSLTESLKPVETWRVASLVVGSRINVALLPRPETGKLALSLVPLSLASAILLQAAQSLASGLAIRVCSNCGGWFGAGASSERKADAHYCTDNCRYAFNNRLKKDRKGHIRERSPVHWAIVLDLRDPETGTRRRKWLSFKGQSDKPRRSARA